MQFNYNKRLVIRYAKFLALSYKTDSCIQNSNIHHTIVFFKTIHNSKKRSCMHWRQVMCKISETGTNLLVLHY